MAIRTYQYDDNGNQTVVTEENGDSVTMSYDSRGNVTSKKTCRTATECQTSYTTYPATVTDPFDPRNDLPIYASDARSASATDTTYRTAYTYTSFGELASQTNPDGSLVTHTYSQRRGGGLGRRQRARRAAAHHHRRAGQADPVRLLPQR